MSRGPATAALGGLALVIALGVFFLVRDWRSSDSESSTIAIPGTSDLVPFSKAPQLAEPPSGVPREIAESSAENAKPTEPVGSSDKATIIVRALSKTTRQPLQGVRVKVNSFEVEHGAGVLMSGQTGLDGSIQFVVPTRLPLEIWARPGDGQGGQAFQEIPELSAGERREIVLDMRVGVDLRFVCRVVDAASRQPISGALARVVLPVPSPRSKREPSRTQLEARTSIDGLFAFDLESWRGAPVRVAADGFGLAFVQPVEGHETEADALELQLLSGAALEATLLDATGMPLRGAGVRLSISGEELLQGVGFDGPWFSLPRETWFGEVDNEGRAVLRALPPEVPLKVEVMRELEVIWRPADRLVIGPGQVVTREWRIGGGQRVFGRALDEQDQPVGGLEIWLVRAESNRPRYFEGGEPEIAARVTTNDAGRFEILDVAAGRWWIGPAVETRPTGAEVAPLAIPVEVTNEATEEVLLRVHRGISIRGIVLDSKGEPASEGTVIASMEGADYWIFADVAEGGTFSIGPLAPGRFMLSADSWGNDAESDPVGAESGATDVVLRLRPGGGLRGRVVDASTGKACTAEILITPADSRSGISGSGVGITTQADGSFEEIGLEPGIYDVAARTGDGKFGVASGVSVSAGIVNADLRIVVSPGGVLDLRNDGSEDQLQFRLLFGEVEVTWWTPLPRGQLVRVAAPAGRLRLDFEDVRRSSNSSLPSQTIELKPGERKEIVLPGG